MNNLKGRAVIAQSGGPTRVINASLVGAILAAKRNPDIITSFWGSLHGVEGLVKDNFVDLFNQSEMNLDTVSKTPSSALYSSRKKIGDEKEEISPDEIFNSIKRNEIRFFYYIGGNDSADNTRIINEIAKRNNYEMACFHIPKTIDNDLLVNDHTPGFGTAARYVANVFAGDNYDNLSLPGIKLNIIMGRSAGFLTASSSLARQREEDAPHLIYVPEIAFEQDKFLADLERVYKKYGRAVVAISEGIEDKQKIPLAWDGISVDGHGNPELDTHELEKKLTKLVKSSGISKRLRSDVFGYAQRSYLETVSTLDYDEAYSVGKKAVHFSLFGDKLDGSVAIIRSSGNGYFCKYELTSLDSVAKKTKKMPLDFINHDGNDISPKFIEYARPLIGEPLPKRGSLDMIKVKR